MLSLLSPEIEISLFSNCLESCLFFIVCLFLQIMIHYFSSNKILFLFYSLRFNGTLKRSRGPVEIVMYGCIAKTLL